jgi:hypothetical protein
VFSALALLLLVALGARLAAELLAPLVPALIILVLLCAVYWVIIGRRGRR